MLGPARIAATAPQAESTEPQLPSRQWVSDCWIILTAADSHQLPLVVQFLEAAGVTIDHVDSNHGVIECCGPADQMAGLQRSGLFPYIRVAHNYLVSIPVASARESAATTTQSSLKVA